MPCKKEYKQIQDAKTRIKDFLIEHPDSRIGFISRQLRLDRWVCVRTLRRLQAEGLVYAVSKPITIDGIIFDFIILYGVVDGVKA
jgi:hypothetical protein